MLVLLVFIKVHENYLRKEEGAEKVLEPIQCLIIFLSSTDSIASNLHKPFVPSFKVNVSIPVLDKADKGNKVMFGVQL